MQKGGRSDDMALRMCLSEWEAFTRRSAAWQAAAGGSVDS